MFWMKRIAPALLICAVLLSLVTSLDWAPADASHLGQSVPTRTPTPLPPTPTPLPAADQPTPLPSAPTAPALLPEAGGTPDNDSIWPGLIGVALIVSSALVMRQARRDSSREL